MDENNIEKEKLQIKMSVRNLVEFVLRSGDIDTSFRSNVRAVEGTRAHQKVQKAQGDNYKAEVMLKQSFPYNDFLFIIEGRADGIIENEVDENNLYVPITIDEIKSTNRSLDLIDENYNMLHWAQAKCYGYIYCVQNDLKKINIQLTYFHLESETTKKIVKTYSVDELKLFFFNLLESYIVWAEFTKEWNELRNESIKESEFPFDKYRSGQRELAVAVYKTIKENKKIFSQAPTGIGKTISTIFPTIKAFGEGHTSKVFYLTAKTITRTVAEEAFIKMREKGLKIKSVTITAKEKICFKEEAKCDPGYCEYAKGHFDRVNNALLDILKNEDDLSRNKIENYSEKHKVCPFEFTLDLAIWADSVICDYNYVFDPRVYLKRFFQDNNGDYTFLIDEAHNLVDRSREMYSAELYKSKFLELKRVFKDKNTKISKALDKINSYILRMKKQCLDEDFYLQVDAPNEIFLLLTKLIGESEEWLTENAGKEGHKELLELYFECHAFLRISELYDERYVTYVEKSRSDVKLKMFCLDPSYLLSEAIKRGKSAIFFSATLSPIDYFKDILGGNEEDYTILLSSPFEENNLCLMIANNISTKYKNRENSYIKISEYINAIFTKRKGNYLVFFPSYKYMNDVYEIFTRKYPDTNTIIQQNIMNEEEREEFLNNFSENEDSNLVGFAVMGGIFSEGVDLKGERLIGAIIIGVGLPQICFERNIIRDYFNNQSNKGFEYSYMYPGINKVLQAAGRVIRSEEDKGIVLLIDERFNHMNYQRILPNHWRNQVLVRKENEIIKELDRFYK